MELVIAAKDIKGTRNSRSAFPALNGMRGLAAIAVAIFHAYPLFGAQIVPGGYLAVDLFFVLSGVVISHAYGARLSAGLRVADFLKIRIIRFMPFYLVGLAFGLVLAVALLLAGSPDALPPDRLAIALLFALFFMPVPFGGDIFPLNGPAWSLFYELVVNALYALFFRWLTPAVLMTVILVAVSVLIPGVWAHGSAALGPALGDAPVAFARTVFSFSAGVLVYSWRRPINSALPFVAIVTVMLLMFLPIGRDWRPVFDLTCIVLVFPLSVFVLLGSGTVSARQSRAFEFLGDMSYGLYAVHYPLIWIVRGASGKLGFDSAYAGLMLIALLVVSSASIERRIDSPLRSWLTARLVPIPRAKP